MRKPKDHYSVFFKYFMITEDIEDSFEDEWQFAGDTWAVSEAQAINNVRYRMGHPSQYKPLAVSGHWDTWMDWKAIKEERKEEKIWMKRMRWSKR